MNRKVRMEFRDGQTTRYELPHSSLTRHIITAKPGPILHNVEMKLHKIQPDGLFIYREVEPLKKAPE